MIVFGQRSRVRRVGTLCRLARQLDVAPCALPETDVARRSAWSLAPKASARERPVHLRDPPPAYPRAARRRLCHRRGLRATNPVRGVNECVKRRQGREMEQVRHERDRYGAVTLILLSSCLAAIRLCSV